MKDFYLGWEILQTLSAELEARVRLPEDMFQTASGISAVPEIGQTASAEFEARPIGPPPSGKSQGPKLPPRSAESQTGGILQTVSALSRQAIDIRQLTDAFPLSWSHYVRLMSVEKPHARAFYESEALRGGWSVRQLDRQISTQFFERTAHSKQPAALLARGQKPKPEDAVSAEDEAARRRDAAPADPENQTRS
jgi:hypothetical protein